DAEEKAGIPIGNLSSQLFANLYLDVFDKYVKETLRVHRYMRYMDDFLILSNDKEELKILLSKIETFLWHRLRLRLNPKTTIIDVSSGLDFCGYRHFATHKKVRKRSIKKMFRTVRAYKRGKISAEKIRMSLASWLGHIGYADSWRTRQRLLAEIYGSRPHDKE
ncbi:MAG: RNA-directed DNA polymerase, partial [Synergistaceae bacterium]|nr:RNA-directed DNA polymerase [Synergistaceae bacterium]